MLIGIMSDSHDHLAHVEQAIALFQARGVEVVIHAGDIVSPPMIKLFEGCGMKLVGVLGNNDGEKLGLAKFFVKAGGELHGEFADVEAGGLRLGVYHGTSYPLLQGLIASGTYDVVVSGHTHAYESRQVGSVQILNPGTTHGFGESATVMLLDTQTRKTEKATLS